MYGSDFILKAGFTAQVKGKIVILSLGIAYLY